MDELKLINDLLHQCLALELVAIILVTVGMAGVFIGLTRDKGSLQSSQRLMVGAACLVIGCVAIGFSIEIHTLAYRLQETQKSNMKGFICHHYL
jgi:ammonia channel protein AmtB